MVQAACGQCTRPQNALDSVLDKEKTGRGGLAQKATAKEAIQDVDQYTELTFPVAAHDQVSDFMGELWIFSTIEFLHPTYIDSTFSLYLYCSRS